MAKCNQLTPPPFKGLTSGLLKNDINKIYTVVNWALYRRVSRSHYLVIFLQTAYCQCFRLFALLLFTAILMPSCSVLELVDVCRFAELFVNRES